MNMTKICGVLGLFFCIAVRSADQQIATQAAIKALVKYTNPLTKVPMLWHRMDLQDSMNEILLFQEQQNAEDIKKCATVLEKLTHGFELQEGYHTSHDAKFKTLDLVVGKMHKEIEDLKRHFGMFTQSIVEDAQSTKEILTLNDIREHQPTVKDLIRLCESLEVSNTQLKQKIDKDELVIASLQLQIARLSQHIPALQNESKYVSPSGCSSPNSMECETSTPRDMPSTRVKSAPHSPRISTHTRKRSSSDSLANLKNGEYSFDTFWTTESEDSQMPDVEATLPLQPKQHSSDSYKREFSSAELVSEDSDEDDASNDSHSSGSDTGSDSEFIPDQKPDDQTFSVEFLIQEALPVKHKRCRPSGKKVRSFHRKGDQTNQTPN